MNYYSINSFARLYFVHIFNCAHVLGRYRVESVSPIMFQLANLWYSLYFVMVMLLLIVWPRYYSVMYVQSSRNYIFLLFQFWTSSAVSELQNHGVKHGVKHCIPTCPSCRCYWSRSKYLTLFMSHNEVQLPELTISAYLNEWVSDIKF